MRNENVLVVPAAVLHLGQGFTRHEGNEHLLEAIKHHAQFQPRHLVEEDPTYKQIIPYVIFRNGSRVFLMQRTKQGSEQRLHDKFSIGIGGHINTTDSHADVWTMIENWLQRELTEEITYRRFEAVQFLGYINRNETPVDQVHLGLLFVLDGSADTEAVAPEITGQMIHWNKIDSEKLEGWSQIAFEALAQRQKL
ncbi:MAG: hypothetical protein HY832_03440 [Candidatus Aenigmarchaeota archaeon]|nr:hypothetical protein [Candidatus Aenigmarchaeota archaeon]